MPRLSEAAHTCSGHHTTSSGGGISGSSIGRRCCCCFVGGGCPPTGRSTGATPLIAVERSSSMRRAWCGGGAGSQLCGRRSHAAALHRFTPRRHGTALAPGVGHWLCRHGATPNTPPAAAAAATQTSARASTHSSSNSSSSSSSSGVAGRRGCWRCGAVVSPADAAKRGRSAKYGHRFLTVLLYNVHKNGCAQYREDLCV